MAEDMTRAEKFWLNLTNRLYLVPRQVRAFQQRHPDARVLAAGAAKGRRMAQGAPLQREAGWITAKRAALILTDDALVCGDWRIPLTSVTAAKLILVPNWSMRALVLQVTTTDQHYNFGLLYDPAWVQQTVLPLSIEEGKVGFSLFSIALRVIVFGLLIWWILDRLF